MNYHTSMDIMSATSDLSTTLWIVSGKHAPRPGSGTTSADIIANAEAALRAWDGRTAIRGRGRVASRAVIHGLTTADGLRASLARIERAS